MGVAAALMPHVDAWLREAPAPVIDHRQFGLMRASFRRDSDGFTWECLDLVPTRRGVADLEFEASAWGPTSAHENQLDAVLSNLDALTDSARQIVMAKFGEMSGMEWQGARLTGRTGAFELHFWCDAGDELLVTVVFERSQPTSARLHD
jgi:hypothetical protein